jgi:hypothetical protein
VTGRYVVNENGERVAILLDIEEYERIVAQHHTSADMLDDEEEDFDPEESERRISEFITSAEKLPGPPVAELADDVAEVMRAAWRDIETIMSGKLHNKVLATQLLLGQRARGLQKADDPEHWRFSAATTLLSGRVISSLNQSG